nr:hypothetical protein [bacterium]
MYYQGNNGKYRWIAFLTTTGIVFLLGIIVPALTFQIPEATKPVIFRNLTEFFQRVKKIEIARPDASNLQKRLEKLRKKNARRKTEIQQRVSRTDQRLSLEQQNRERLTSALVPSSSRRDFAANSRSLKKRGDRESVSLNVGKRSSNLGGVEQSKPTRRVLSESSGIQKGSLRKSDGGTGGSNLSIARSSGPPALVIKRHDNIGINLLEPLLNWMREHPCDLPAPLKPNNMMNVKDENITAGDSCIIKAPNGEENRYKIYLVYKFLEPPQFNICIVENDPEGAKLILLLNNSDE